MLFDENKIIGVRKPLRLAGYDYSSIGGYFVTIATHDMAQLFGIIQD
jgi:hypothetical protein